MMVFSRLPVAGFLLFKEHHATGILSVHFRLSSWRCLPELAVITSQVNKYG